ncbi:MAG: hypothetical protein LBS94_04790, partial [Prevotellaceae bacterium]|nr:hypothetical protein [Prevotellaceae bacterium]
GVPSLRDLSVRSLPPLNPLEKPYFSKDTLVANQDWRGLAHGAQTFFGAQVTPVRHAERLE